MGETESILMIMLVQLNKEADRTGFHIHRSNTDHNFCNDNCSTFALQLPVYVCMTTVRQHLVQLINQ